MLTSRVATRVICVWAVLENARPSEQFCLRIIEIEIFSNLLFTRKLCDHQLEGWNCDIVFGIISGSFRAFQKEKVRERCVVIRIRG